MTPEWSSSSSTYRFAPPVFGIRIKDKLTFIGKGQVKEEHEGGNGHERQPLQPHGAAGTFVIGGKGKENQQQQEDDLDFLT